MLGHPVHPCSQPLSWPEIGALPPSFPPSFRVAPAALLLIQLAAGHEKAPSSTRLPRSPPWPSWLTKVAVNSAMVGNTYLDLC